MTDYVAVGYDVAGKVHAFTTGELKCCKAAAKAYRQHKSKYGWGREYAKVKVMSWDEWMEKYKHEI